MKNLFKLAVVALGVITINACKTADTPDKVAEKFLNHLEKKEFSEAKALATEKSAKMIDMQESINKSAGDIAKPAVIAGVKCTISGDTTAVCEYTKDNEAGEPLKMLKKDGKWLVNMEKETPDMNLNSIMDDSTAIKEDTTASK